MKILVSGAAGFIGHNLTKKLLKRGDTVVGLDNINDYYDPALKYGRLKDIGIEKEEIKDKELCNSIKYENLKFIKLDLCDRQNMLELFESEKFDAICHLGAQAGVRYSIENPYAYIDSNIIGFLNILEGCRHSRVNNLSFASSSSVYGLNKSFPFKTTDHTDHPVSLYAATKKSNEMMAHTYSHLYGIKTTALRFFTVYGPWGRPDMAPMLFANAILNDKAIKVFNHGKMSRDFTYIDDISEGIVKVIDNPASLDKNWNAKNALPNSSSAPFKIYNIGNNKPVSLMEFIEILEKKLGKKAKKEMLDMQPGDVESTYADVKDLIEDTGYAPNTSLEEGIGKFVEWYRYFYQK